MTVGSWKTLLALLGVVWAAWFVGGVIVFPDGPLHRCTPYETYKFSYQPYSYCGKQGQSRSEVDFRNYEVWQISVFLLPAAGMITAGLLRGRQNRKAD